LSLLVLLVIVGAAKAGTDQKNRALDQFIRGTVADQMEDRYRAVFHYQEALRYDSASAFVYVALAQDYVLLGNPAAAETMLAKALTIHPGNVSALELKSVILRGMGKMPEARNVLRQLVQAAPGKVDYLRQLLSMELALKNYDDVDRLCRDIETAEQGSTEILRQVLSVYLTTGEHKRAIALLEDLVAADSTDAGLLYALGSSYAQVGDTTRGERLVRRALNINPDEPRFWIGMAVIAMDKRDFARTVSVVDSALENVTANSALLSLKGTALQRLGRRHDALTTLAQAVNLDSSLFVAMGTIALIYDELDSLDRAVYWYERAIQASDSAAIYLNNLAYTYATRGAELQKAQALAARALELDSLNGAYMDTMGWIEYGLGHYDAALVQLKRAIKRSKDGATIYEHIGDTYAKLGSAGKAAKFYRKALELEPNNETLRHKIGH
jgi:tetratricopeptide (TPR) repeat protein